MFDSPGVPVRSRTFAVFLVISGACAHIPDPSEPGVPDGAAIERVTVEGLESLDHGALVEGLANRPPALYFYRTPLEFFPKDYFRFDDLQIELDRKRIRSFYAQRGFFGVEVAGPELTPVEGDADRLTVTWRVKEGLPTRVRQIFVLEAPAELEARLAAESDLNEGDVYETHLFESSKAKMRAVLVARGFATAQVDGEVEIDRRRGEARVVFRVKSGPRVHLDDLFARGQTRTPTSAVVLRRTWASGDVFDPATLDRLRGRLYGLDQYSSVRLDFEGGALASATTNIVATVDEAERNELQLGVGGAVDPVNYSFRVRARYKRRNFPFSLTNAYVELSPSVSFVNADTTARGELTPEGRVGLIWYDFIWPLFELDSDLGYQLQQLEAYEWQGFDAGQTLRRSILKDKLQIGLGWRFQHYQYGDIRIAGPEDPRTPIDTWGGFALPPQSVMNVDDAQSVIILQPSLTYEGRNDPLEPTRGLYAAAGVEFGLATGSEAAGGPLDFILLNAEVRGYLPFFAERLVLAGRVNFSSNLDGQLPAPRRLFAGGASSQRGFAQRRLSPLAPFLEGDGDQRQLRLNDDLSVAVIPIGDETLVELNLEARFRIVKIFGLWLGLTGFLDGADIGGRAADLNIPELHYAAGLGLRYLTPVGAIRIDYGVRLNRTQEAPWTCSGFTDCAAFHITLGQAF